MSINVSIFSLVELCFFFRLEHINTQNYRCVYLSSLIHILSILEPGSAVSIVSTLRPGRSRVRILIRTRDLSPLRKVQASCGARLVNNERFKGKEWGCDVDHPPPSTTKIKNGWSYASEFP